MLGRSCEPAYSLNEAGALAAVAALGAGRRLVRGRRHARRPRGELLRHLAGKLIRGPAGRFRRPVPDLIRQLAAAAEGYRSAEQRRSRVFACAFRRRFAQLDLLKRTCLKRPRLKRTCLKRPRLKRRRLKRTCLKRTCLKRPRLMRNLLELRLL